MIDKTPSSMNEKSFILRLKAIEQVASGIFYFSTMIFEPSPAANKAAGSATP